MWLSKSSKTGRDDVNSQSQHSQGHSNSSSSGKRRRDEERSDRLALQNASPAKKPRGRQFSFEDDVSDDEFVVIELFSSDEQEKSSKSSGKKGSNSTRTSVEQKEETGEHSQVSPVYDTTSIFKRFQHKQDNNKGSVSTNNSGPMFTQQETEPDLPLITWPKKRSRPLSQTSSEQSQKSGTPVNSQPENLAGVVRGVISKIQSDSSSDSDSDENLLSKINKKLTPSTSLNVSSEKVSPVFRKMSGDQKHPQLNSTVSPVLGSGKSGRLSLKKKNAGQISSDSFSDLMIVETSDSGRDFDKKNNSASDEFVSIGNKNTRRTPAQSEKASQKSNYSKIPSSKKRKKCQKSFLLLSSESDDDSNATKTTQKLKNTPAKQTVRDKLAKQKPKPVKDRYLSDSDISCHSTKSDDNLVNLEPVENTTLSSQNKSITSSNLIVSQSVRDKLKKMTGSVRKGNASKENILQKCLPKHVGPKTCINVSQRMSDKKKHELHNQTSDEDATQEYNDDLTIIETSNFHHQPSVMSRKASLKKPFSLDSEATVEYCLDDKLKIRNEKHSASSSLTIKKSNLQTSILEYVAFEDSQATQEYCFEDNNITGNTMNVTTIMNMNTQPAKVLDSKRSESSDDDLLTQPPDSYIDSVVDESDIMEIELDEDEDDDLTQPIVHSQVISDDDQDTQEPEMSYGGPPQLSLKAGVSSVKHGSSVDLDGPPQLTQQVLHPSTSTSGSKARSATASPASTIGYESDSTHSNKTLTFSEVNPSERRAALVKRTSSRSSGSVDSNASESCLTSAYLRGNIFDNLEKTQTLIPAKVRCSRSGSTDSSNSRDILAAETQIQKPCSKTSVSGVPDILAAETQIQKPCSKSTVSCVPEEDVIPGTESDDSEIYFVQSSGKSKHVVAPESIQHAQKTELHPVAQNSGTKLHPVAPLLEKKSEKHPAAHHDMITPAELNSSKSVKFDSNIEIKDEPVTQTFKEHPAAHNEMVTQTELNSSKSITFDSNIEIKEEPLTQTFNDIKIKREGDRIDIPAKLPCYTQEEDVIFIYDSSDDEALIDLSQTNIRSDHMTENDSEQDMFDHSDSELFDSDFEVAFTNYHAVDHETEERNPFDHLGSDSDDQTHVSKQCHSKQSFDLANVDNDETDKISPAKKKRLSVLEISSDDSDNDRSVTARHDSFELDLDDEHVYVAATLLDDEDDIYGNFELADEKQTESGDPYVAQTLVDNKDPYAVQTLVDDKDPYAVQTLVDDKDPYAVQTLVDDEADVEISSPVCDDNELRTKEIQPNLSRKDTVLGEKSVKEIVDLDSDEDLYQAATQMDTSVAEMFVDKIEPVKSVVKADHKESQQSSVHPLSKDNKLSGEKPKRKTASVKAFVSSPLTSDFKSPIAPASLSRSSTFRKDVYETDTQIDKAGSPSIYALKTSTPKPSMPKPKTLFQTKNVDKLYLAETQPMSPPVEQGDDDDLNDDDDALYKALDGLEETDLSFLDSTKDNCNLDKVCDPYHAATQVSGLTHTSVSKDKSDREFDMYGAATQVDSSSHRTISKNRDDYQFDMYGATTQIDPGIVISDESESELNPIEISGDDPSGPSGIEDHIGADDYIGVDDPYEIMTQVDEPALPVREPSHVTSQTKEQPKPSTETIVKQIMAKHTKKRGILISAERLKKKSDIRKDQKEREKEKSESAKPAGTGLGKSQFYGSSGGASSWLSKKKSPPAPPKQPAPKPKRTKKVKQQQNQSFSLTQKIKAAKECQRQRALKVIVDPSLPTAKMKNPVVHSSNSDVLPPDEAEIMAKGLPLLTFTKLVDKHKDENTDVHSARPVEVPMEVDPPCASTSTSTSDVREKSYKEKGSRTSDHKPSSSRYSENRSRSNSIEGEKRDRHKSQESRSNSSKSRSSSKSEDSSKSEYSSKNHSSQRSHSSKDSTSSRSRHHSSSSRSRHHSSSSSSSKHNSSKHTSSSSNHRKSESSSSSSKSSSKSSSNSSKSSPNSSISSSRTDVTEELNPVNVSKERTQSRVSEDAEVKDKQNEAPQNTSFDLSLFPLPAVKPTKTIPNIAKSRTTTTSVATNVKTNEKVVQSKSAPPENIFEKIIGTMDTRNAAKKQTKENKVTEKTMASGACKENKTVEKPKERAELPPGVLRDPRLRGAPVQAPSNPPQSLSKPLAPYQPQNIPKPATVAPPSNPLLKPSAAIPHVVKQPPRRQFSNDTILPFSQVLRGAPVNSIPGSSTAHTDRAKMLKDPSKLMEQTYYLSRVLSWNPVWLQEQDKAEFAGHPPPILKPDESIYPLLESYTNLEDYQNIMTRLLLLETWDILSKEWKQRRNRPERVQVMFCSVDICKKEDKGGLSKFIWQGLLTREQYRKGQYPMESDLVVMNVFCVPIKPHQSNSDVRPVWKPEFGYVERVHVRPADNIHNLLRTYPILKTSIDNPRGEFYLLTVTALGRYRKFKPITDRMMSLESLCNMVTAKRQFQALTYLPRSPLLRDILHPNNERVFCHNTLVQDRSLLKAYNPSQAEAISGVCRAVQEPPHMPRICLLQGPPGTGKTHTVTGIITKIIQDTKGRCCICLCTPSNGAADELMRRLIKIKNSSGRHASMKLVRFGRAKSIHEDVVEYSYDELVDKAKMKGSLPESVQREQRQLREKIDRIQKEISKMSVADNKIKVDRRQADLRKFERELRYLDKQQSAPNQNVQVSRDEETRIRRQVLQEAHVICGTLNSIGSARMMNILRSDSVRNPFMCAIIDEATQSTELDCLIPLQYGVSKLVLVGDPEQLPPTVISQKAKDMKFGLSLFERFYTYLKSHDQKAVMMLKTQYRMDDAILSFPNLYVYDGMLNTDRSVYERTKNFPLDPYVVLNIESGKESISSEGSVSNQTEAECIAQLCQLITSRTRIAQRTIGVVCPYQSQRTLVMNSLAQSGMREVEVNTVDGFQGREKHVIIMSCVRARSIDGSIGFLSDRRRLNVALTRAKYSLFVLGHLDTLKRGADWRALIEDAHRRNVILNVPSTSQFVPVASKCFKTSRK